MDKKRVLYGVFWFFNMFIVTFALYMTIAVQLGVDVSTVNAQSIAGAFQEGYQQGQALQKKEAIYFFKKYALKVSVLAFILSVIGTWLGILPGTKANKKSDTTTQTSI